MANIWHERSVGVTENNFDKYTNKGGRVIESMLGIVVVTYRSVFLDPTLYTGTRIRRIARVHMFVCLYNIQSQYLSRRLRSSLPVLYYYEAVTCVWPCLCDCVWRLRLFVGIVIESVSN